MSDAEITINTLKDLQAKFDKLYSITKTKELKEHYSNMVNCIDDIIEELKEEA